MAPKSIFSNLIRETDGTFSAVYGSFMLKSALQPIFSQDDQGILSIEGFEGLIRTARNGEQVSPGDFFRQVSPDDMQMIDSLCRTLHILNTGSLNRTKSRLFVNFHPGLFTSDNAIRQEVDRMRIAVREAGLTNDRIACEISRKSGEDLKEVLEFVEHLRALGFKIAVDEYGAEESDVERVDLLRPDFVKFEAGWVRNFLDNSAGFALLKVMVNKFKDRDVTTIFEGLEDLVQVDLCRELGVPLLQGYALARPEIAPTSFNERFPEFDTPARTYPSRLAESAQPRYASALPVYRAEPTGARRATSFGRRGL